MFLNLFKNGLMNENNKTFIFDWILLNSLAIGNAPERDEDLEYLESKRIKNILSLCSEEEFNSNKDINQKFNHLRIYLPDSRTNLLPNKTQISNAYYALDEFLKNGITFIHCYASIERSPLICILYIMFEYNMRIEDALDYVKRKHKISNPTNSQLRLLYKFKKNTI